MTLVLILGGARSGKSGLALRLAERAHAPLFFIATGEPGDDEMADRIDRHRGERSPEWTTIEESAELERALRSVPAGATAVVDCLSLWVSNLIESRSVQEIEDAAAAAAAAAHARAGLTVAVTNEVGLGIVPVNPLARSYRDVLGRVNAVWVEASDEAYFVVAGRMLQLQEIE
jgi:adenosylcobinamide kinase / adenosylcobinamide-phosphate guanylyltransferase